MRGPASAIGWFSRCPLLLRIRSSPSPVAEQPISPSPLLQVGSQVGPYKILREAGQGGFGTVYLALQEQPLRRQVALKLIKPGMASRQMLAQFDAERQALALMNHPKGVCHEYQKLIKS